MSTPQVHLWEVGERDFRCLSSAYACATKRCNCHVMADNFEGPTVPQVVLVAGAGAAADNNICGSA
jgi:hypothetical protein